MEYRETCGCHPRSSAQGDTRCTRFFCSHCERLEEVLRVVLFGGTGVDVVMQRGQFVLSLERGWIKFVCETHIIAELLKVCRINI